jgi:hypothetical protein
MVTDLERGGAGFTQFDRTVEPTETAAFDANHLQHLMRLPIGNSSLADVGSFSERTIMNHEDILQAAMCIY